MVIGALAHTATTFFALQGGFATFENVCFALDGLIDKHIDINSFAPFFLNGELLRVKLRCKSERAVWFAYEALVHSYCAKFAQDHEDVANLTRGVAWTREGIDAALSGSDVKRAENVMTVVSCMTTNTFSYAIGDVEWINDPGTVAVRAWLAKTMTNEDRLTILNGLILFDKLREEGRA